MAVKITFKEDKKYGIPELKKYPMPDKQHVISAIKFFNYVTPKYEKQLANAILSRMREYGMSFEDVGVGEDNRFKKYIPARAIYETHDHPNASLTHHGILGMKWGIRRFQNKDGSLTAEGKKHREETATNNNDLSKKYVPVHEIDPEQAKTKNDEFVRQISNSLLSQKDYYSSRGKEAAITGLHALNDLGLREYSNDELADRSNWEWFLFEDQTIGLPQIADLANKGLSSREIKIVTSLATRAYKNSNYYPYGSNEKDPNDNLSADAIWSLNEGKPSSEFIDACVNYVNKKPVSNSQKSAAKDAYKIAADFEKANIDLRNESDNDYRAHKNELKHHGILGQKWGVRRYQNSDGSLTPAGLKRRAQQIDKDNAKFLKKYGDTINKKVEKVVEPYMKVYAERELNTSLRKLKKNGRDSRNYINAYNKRLAQLMNTAVGDLRNPKTDYVVQFIAKRGEYGVHTALAVPGTDMSRYKSGVYGDGRIAYRKEGVKTV